MDANFIDIAIACRGAASAAAVNFETTEKLAAGLATVGVDRALRELKAQNDLLGMAHELFKRMAPHESAIRALMSKE